MPQDAPSLPSVLQSRVAAAQKRLAGRQPATPTPATPAKTPHQPAPKPTPQAAKPTPKPKPTKNAGTEAKEGGCQRGEAPPSNASQLRAMARNPVALSMVSDAQLEAIWSAMVDNAALRGSTGAMDRQALFRAAGLPFQGGIGAVGGKPGQPGAGPALSARLEKALSRVARRNPVTEAEADDAEAVEMAGFGGEAHKIGDRARVPTDRAEGE